MPITVLGGTKLADTAYEVANSCRFNDGDSAYMEKSPASDGSNTTATFSAWVKRCNLGARQAIFGGQEGTDTNNRCVLEFNASDQLVMQTGNAGSFVNKVSNRLFKDVSAWYHLVFQFDTTNGTAASRWKFFVNGVEETSLATDDTFPDSADIKFFENTTSCRIAVGMKPEGSNNVQFFDGYMAEVVVIDGTVLAPTSFGEYNDDSPNIWQPIDVSGLTFGTNGFYLDFEASGNLGNDANGGTDLTETNLAAADQATDSPTNNFCTINSRFHTNWQSQVTNTKEYAQGNCTLLENTHSAAIGTMGTTTMPFYYEIKLSASDMSSGVMATNPAASVTATIASYNDATAYGFYPEDSSQYRFTAGSWTSDSTFSGSGIYHYAVDPVNNKLWVGKDGTWDGDPAAGTGNIVTLGTHEYTPWAHCSGSGGTNIGEFNFGGCSAFAVSSGNADANGYGDFEFAVPSGFYALCSKNLGENG
tara:strand:- start:1140 stop:2564 length:1425 start_codon:yes stop_codon:yes gene_type:complete